MLYKTCTHDTAGKSLRPDRLTGPLRAEVSRRNAGLGLKTPPLPSFLYHFFFISQVSRPPLSSNLTKK
ncbi:uncharacterized protein A4U43_C05F3310, partial [Asparagus officinalis]